MSATGRSDVRRPGDAYFTPRWVTALVAPFVPELLDPHATVLDPAAGTGELLAGLLDAGARCRLLGLEVDRATASLGGLPVEIADALAVGWGRPDAAVMNPPFSLALPFVARALEQTSRGGTVAALLPLGFLGSELRCAWLRENAPDLKIISRRPSFTGGGTDSAVYAWHLWRAGVRRTVGTVEVLECPPAERSRKRRAA